MFSPITQALFEFGLLGMGLVGLGKIAEYQIEDGKRQDAMERMAYDSVHRADYKLKKAIEIADAAKESYLNSYQKVQATIFKNDVEKIKALKSVERAAYDWLTKARACESLAAEHDQALSVALAALGYGGWVKDVEMYRRRKLDTVKANISIASSDHEQAKLALQTSIAGSSFATLCCYVAEKHSSTFAAAALAAAGLTIMYNAHRVNKGSIGAAVSTQIFKSSMSLR